MVVEAFAARKYPSEREELSSIKSLLRVPNTTAFLWAGLFRSFIQLLRLAFSTSAVVDLLFAHFNFPKSLLQATFFESRRSHNRERSFVAVENKVSI